MQVQAAGLSGDEETVTVGEGTTTSKKTAPFYCYNKNGATETIYTSDEIGMSGAVKAIAWQASSANTLMVTNLKVYLGHTTQSVFTDSAITPEDLTLVYTSDQNFAGEAGFRQIVLDTPFEYNGTDNLLVVVVWAGNYSSSPEFYVESKSNMVWAKTSDSYADSFTDWETIRDASSPSVEYPGQRPNIQLAIEENIAEGAPTIVTSSLPSVNLGADYSASIKVKANPAATVTVSGLPDGLSFDAPTMTISGKPTQAGTFPVTITATNGNSPDATTTLDLVVTTEAPAITTESLPGGKVGKAYSATIEATGVPAPSISVAGLPAGLAFDANTNTISGTPTEAGEASVTITAHNGYGDDAVKPFTFTIKSAAASEEISVVVGTGTTDTKKADSPLSLYYNNAVDQSVYLASEIANDGEEIDSGRINAVSLYVSSASSLTCSRFDIYLGYTDATEAASGGVAVTDNVLVYTSSDNPVIGANEGWETYAFAEPFDYDSSKGNLVMTILRMGNNYNANLGYQSTSGKKTGCYEDDNTGYADFATGSAKISKTKNYRANIKLDMEVGGAAPKFSVQPEGFTYKVGDPQSNTVSATATSKVGVPTFVWYKSASGDLADATAVAANATAMTESAEGAAADGAYVSTYIPAASDLTAVGEVYYYCVATDSVGSTASKPATAQVYDQDAQAPTGTFAITSEPAAEDGIVTAGETTTVAFTASGAEPAAEGDVLYYQWYKKGADDADFVEIEGATETTYEAKVVVGQTAYQCRVHASHQIASNVSEDVASNTITINGTALTITTAEELAAFRDAVNAGDTFNGRTALLGADIDISAIDGGWTPIGLATAAKRFAGTFDGQGHTITIGAFADDITAPALFGFVRGEATIKNLTVAGTIESTQYSVSAVANTSYGATFENVRNLANVSTSYASGGRAAGLVAGVGAGGADDPTVFLNCVNKGAIKSVGTSGYASGIANLAATSAGCIATFKNCYNTGTITGQATMSGDCYISGIVSVNKSNNNANTLTNCYNAGTLSGGDYERGYGLATKATLVGDNYYRADAHDGGVGTPAGTGAAVSKTADEMAAADFATLLGESYIAGSALDPAQATPALAWEDAGSATVNTPPALAEGYESEATASQFAGVDWTIDLSDVFVDADGDELAYTVAINDGEAETIDAAYSYTTPESGDTKLVFTASDNEAGSATYTVTLTQREITTATIDYTSQMAGGFLHAPQFDAEVASNEAELFGYSDEVSDGVSALDVLVAAHELVFGEDFTANPAGYLKVSNNNVDMQFGIEGKNVELWSGDPSYKGMFFVNRAFPNDGTMTSGMYNGTVVGTQKVSDGDIVEFFFNENGNYADTYNWFVGADNVYSRSFSVNAGADLDLVLMGLWVPDPAQRLADEQAIVNFDSASEQDEVQLNIVDLESGKLTAIEGAVTADGEVTVSFENPGEYWITAYGDDDMATQILTLTKITVNGVPTLAEGVEPEAEAETAHGQAYELDLDSIFADPNDDEMTYTVSVNGAEPVAADAAYSYTPDENGETTLVFTASDGSALASAATYTVKLTAKDPNTIHVTVSITKYGQIVTGKDGALVAQLPIELNTKLSYTISDALEAAHEAAYEGGAAAGYATYVSAWGPGISMLWGDTSYNFGYQVNAGTVAVMGVGDAINDGDAIDAYVAQNAYPDTEAYAVFDQAAATIETGNALDLVLKESFFDPDTYAMSMVPCVGAAVHVNGESAEGAPVTDDAGKASISFDKPGTYVVTATKTKVVGENTVTAITAPVCTVTVMQNKAALRDAIAAAEAADVALASDETKTALADKLAAAKATLEKADATEDEIAAAASELATATANAVASAKENAANGLPVGSTFTVKDANGTWTYKVTATKQVTLTKATATKKKGKVTINTVAYQGVTYNVTAIGSNALKGSKLASVVVGDNVTSIGAQAFAKSKLLKKMTIGKNVASIGAKAFKGDKKLKKITLKSAKLTSKKAVKGSLKGSKVKTIKLSGMNKAAKKQVKKAFKKAGKKGVKVK